MHQLDALVEGRHASLLADAGALHDARLEAIQLARQPGTYVGCCATTEGYGWDTAVMPALMALYLGGGADGGRP